MKKEIKKIKLLVNVINDSASSENEKEVSRKKIVIYAKKLINQVGIDAHKQENWIVSGYLRFLFENNRVTFNVIREIDKVNMDKVISVLEYHKIPFKRENGNGRCFKRILL